MLWSWVWAQFDIIWDLYVHVIWTVILFMGIYNVLQYLLGVSLSVLMKLTRLSWQALNNQVDRQTFSSIKAGHPGTPDILMKTQLIKDYYPNPPVASDWANYFPLLSRVQDIKKSYSSNGQELLLQKIVDIFAFSLFEQFVVWIFHATNCSFVGQSKLELLM